MKPEYLYTIKWTQPYTGGNQYLQNLWNLYEVMLEKRISEPGGCDQAAKEIERIMKL